MEGKFSNDVVDSSLRGAGIRAATSCFDVWEFINLFCDSRFFVDVSIR